MHRVIDINNVGNFQLLLKFNEGESKLINFEPLIGDGISAPLLDKAYFSKVSIDNGGGIEWPNGMDFCPNILKDYVTNSEFQIESKVS